MPAALLRHGIVLVLAIGVLWVQGVVRETPVGDSPVAWLAISIALGVIAAIVARSLTGAVFLVGGMLVGVMLLLGYQESTTAGVGDVLAQDGWLYAAMIAAALEAYLIVLLVFIRLRERRRYLRPATTAADDSRLLGRVTAKPGFGTSRTTYQYESL